MFFLKGLIALVAVVSVISGGVVAYVYFGGDDSPDFQLPTLSVTNDDVPHDIDPSSMPDGGILIPPNIQEQLDRDEGLLPFQLGTGIRVNPGGSTDFSAP